MKGNSEVAKEDRAFINERFVAMRKHNLEKRKLDSLAQTIKPTMRDVAYALRECDGNITVAARFLGISRRLLAYYVNERPALNRLVEDIRAENLDIVEYQLMSQAKEGVLPAVIMVLKTLGRERGYSEKSTLEHEIGRGAQSAADLISAMRDGATMAREIESTDYTWMPENEPSEPLALPVESQDLTS